MENHEWLFPTLERLTAILRYPNQANEYNTAKVTSAAARRALLLLTKHMNPETPAPRLVPTIPGGLLLEWHEYWVDCTLIIEPCGKPKMRLHVHGSAVASEIVEGDLAAEDLLGKALFMIHRLLKDGPPVPAPIPAPAAPPLLDQSIPGGSPG